MTSPHPEHEPGAAQPLSMSGGPTGPTVLRILLGAQLRKLREEHGVSRESAAEAIRGSHAKISRMELGRVKAKERDVRDLLTLYGITDPAERDPLLTMTRDASAPGWWGHYHDVLPDWFETYLGLEQAADLIRDYQAQFIPELLQTPDYARALVTATSGPRVDVERRIDVRTRRQDILTRDEYPCSLWAVIDEAALRRPYGSAEIMRGQIDHLLAMSERPNVTIQVVPYRIGAHAAASGPFTVLRFPQPDLPDVVYLEQLTSALYLDKPHDVDAYLAVLDRLSVQADDPDRSRGFLRSL